MKSEFGAPKELTSILQRKNRKINMRQKDLNFLDRNEFNYSPSKEVVEALKNFDINKLCFYTRIYDEGKKHISIASLGKEIYDRTIVINGVSKSYAMTGWRIGFAAAPLEVAKLMASLQSHMASNPNSIAQEATLAALEGPQDCVAEMCKEFKKRRDYIYEREEAIPMISALKPEGAFYLFVDVSGTYGKSYEGTEIHSAADFAAILIAEKYVAVVPCADFGMPDYIRLSYATDMEQIKKGMDRIEEMVKALA